MNRLILLAFVGVTITGCHAGRSITRTHEFHEEHACNGAEGYYSHTKSRGPAVSAGVAQSPVAAQGPVVAQSPVLTTAGGVQAGVMPGVAPTIMAAAEQTTTGVALGFTSVKIPIPFLKLYPVEKKKTITTPTVIMPVATPTIAPPVVNPVTVVKREERREDPEDVNFDTSALQERADALEKRLDSLIDALESEE